MTPERWQEVKTLLDGCAELSPADRSQWLDQACRGDTSLKQQVEGYLSYEDDLRDFIEVSPTETLFASLEDSAAFEGKLIGRYRAERLIGSGGMGAVYLAYRESDFEQRVALKLMQSGLASPETIRRFHTERQILANLEHPNIARLLDGGTDDGGRPYFAMELVEGTPIDLFCDDHKLPVTARLQLFLQVCEALQFAHSNLVIHRDLKPGNILVTDDGIPKLLDFGIAKLLRSEGAGIQEDPEGDQAMTLRYASPEQLRGAPISTANDIYSLGVVLYLLLAGRLPEGLNADRPADVARAVCELPPGLPSTAARDQPEKAARAFSASPRAWHRRLHGDLDAIVLRTLAKEPAERYASVEQLAVDLRRHLDDLPVHARRRTLAYRASKFGRRNRWALATATLVLALILGFTHALVEQLERTERERDRAARLSSFLVNLFRAAEPDSAGEEPSVRELVDVGRKRLETELSDEPEARADLLGTLGQVYYRLGHLDAAGEAHRTAIGILRDPSIGDHPTLARAFNDLAAVAFQRGELSQAEDLWRQSLAMRERLGVDADLTKPRNNLASVLVLRGKLQEAAAIYRQGLVERRARFGERHINVARSLRNLGRVHYLASDFSAAEPLLRQALEIRLEHHDRDTPAVATVLGDLGRLAHARGDPDAAETLLHEALDIHRRRLGGAHLKVATLEKDLAEIARQRGDLDTAGTLLERAQHNIHQQRAEGDWIRADVQSVYGAYLANLGRLDEAEPILRQAYENLERVRGANILPTLNAGRRLAQLEAKKTL
ncbi:MAG: serine/threonine-protein kinase [Acidobacteriota bacterium]